MNYFALVFKSAFRNRTRSIMTTAGMAVAVLSFLFLRTVVDVWNSGISAAAQDRLATRHKISITMTLPKTHYQKIIDRVPNLSGVTYANWFGAVYPPDEHGFFANFAINGDTYFKVYNELVIPPDQLQAWQEDRAGAVVGPQLAKKYGWKIGDRVTLRGTIYPGDWTFNVRAIYDTTSKSFDKSTFMFHWDYLNDAVSETRKEQIGFLGVRVADPRQGAQVARAIDELFASSDAETLTESERAFNLEFVSMYSAILTAMDVVSIVILLIMTLIVANTIAMGVRERAHEYGVLRAIGFKPKHLLAFVFGESTLIAVLGGCLGIAIAFPVISGFGKVIEDNLSGMFPYFSMNTSTMMIAGGLSLAVGLISAIVPADSNTPTTCAGRLALSSMS